MQKTTTSKWPKKLVIAAVLWLTLGPWAGISQADSSESGFRSFVSEIGSMIYAYAWPTAKYQGVNFGGIRDTANGTEVTFRVYGLSAFDDSSLWTDVVIVVSEGRISDLHWGRNNAILAQPGSTMKALGEALGELTREYQASHPQGASPTATLSNQFSRNRAQARSNGLTETHNTYTSKLTANGIENITLTLNAGTTYLIAGVCDQDCTDLDLRVYDSAGQLVASDLKADDHPVVAVIPSQTSTYTVQVAMTRCARAPCYFGTQVFGK